MPFFRSLFFFFVVLFLVYIQKFNTVTRFLLYSLKAIGKLIIFYIASHSALSLLLI